MELREALAQIEEIRLQMAKTETFRGFKAQTAAFSGLLALAAAFAQAIYLPDPAELPSAYMALWIGVAAISAGAAGMEMTVRAVVSRSRLVRETTLLAVEQFLPALVAGGLATLILYRFAPEHIALLPGLWAMFYALGIFACWRLLPRPIFLVGLFYLAAGTISLASAASHPLSPWAMGATFGAGQLAAAAVLHWTLERDA